MLLEQDRMATVQRVADYYEVPKGTIDTLISRNCHEIDRDGYRVINGGTLREFKEEVSTDSHYASQLENIFGARIALLDIKKVASVGQKV